MKSMLRRLILCPFGFHARNRNRAKRIDGQLTSRCKHCGTAMYKDWKRGWRAGSPTREGPGQAGDGRA
jgi:hypothetical protein